MSIARATLQDEIVDIWQHNRTTVIWITNDPDEAILVACLRPLLPTARISLRCAPACSFGLDRLK